MSRESEKTTENFLNNLKEKFKNSPYALAEQHEQDDYMPDKLLLSVIIPARNEFPNIVHTCYSIWNCWEADGFDHKDMEIIIVDNCSNEQGNERYDWTKPGDKGTTAYLMMRGAYYGQKIRVIYDPIAGNHSARNKGAEIAKGKYLFFSDAHMAYKIGFFKNMLKTIDETGGLFHGAIAWMGAYPSETNEGEKYGVGLGYTIKLGEEIKGTWNNYHLTYPDGKLVKDWWYIPALGHCSVGVLRKQFHDFGGYPKVHRTYGGGEFYLNMKWWMFGSSVATHPNAIGYHLASSRGYSYNHDDYIHNVLNIGWALSMDEWVERAYLNWLRRGRKEVMDKMMKEAKKEMEEDRGFIASKRKKTFNEVIVERPWDRLNQEKYGNFCKSRNQINSASLSVFHDSWLTLLRQSPQYVQDIYDNSKLQKELEDFINTHLGQYVYKREKL